MLYNPYNNISSIEYERIDNRLNNIEPKLTKHLKRYSFIRSKKEDSLALDYIINKSGFWGNLGIMIKDIPDNFLFELYILKAYDDNSLRYSKTITFKDNISLDELEKDFIKLFSDAVSIYQKIEKSEIIEYFDMDNFSERDYLNSLKQ